MALVSAHSGAVEPNRVYDKYVAMGQALDQAEVTGVLCLDNLNLFAVSSSILVPVRLTQCGVRRVGSGSSIRDASPSPPVPSWQQDRGPPIVNGNVQALGSVECERQQPSVTALDLRKFDTSPLDPAGRKPFGGRIPLPYTCAIALTSTSRPSSLHSLQHGVVKRH